jgi:NAD(P)-dependent dehydrogenase (short-subunit alcohol dehydrogenase family)/acyl carrier protein
MALPEPDPNRPSFRHGGVYLITGGLGNVGFEISKFLAEQYRAKLVLVGRSKLPDRAQWRACLEQGDDVEGIRQKIERLVEIERLGGEVFYGAIDVGDEVGMRQLMHETIRRFGAIHGLIHGAGIVGSKAICEIASIEIADCDQHFAAKAAGLRVLERVLAGQTLDFSMALSSLTPILGGIGEAVYSASNLFMDAFVRRHNRQKRGDQWISVNWDLWRLGKAESGGAVDGKTLAELGITVEEGLKVLPIVLGLTTTAQLVVSTGDLDTRIRQWIKLDSLRNPREAQACRVPGIVPAQAGPPAALFADETEQAIAQIWQQTLGVPQVRREDHFGDLGGHSLLAIRIVSDLRRAFQVELSIRALFDYPTVATLAEYIRAQILAEIEGLSDEEAEDLVEHGGNGSRAAVDDAGDPRLPEN